MTLRQLTISTAIGVAAAGLLGACANAGTPPVDLPTATIEGTSPAATASASPTVLTSTPLPGPAETKPVITEQYATDPTTVDLASDRPTLVKFFAFW